MRNKAKEGKDNKKGIKDETAMRETWMQRRSRIKSKGKNPRYIAEVNFQMGFNKKFVRDEGGRKRT